ncbi:chemotaxis protein CheW [Marinilabiliaceae bacterium JC017]|nr:chemotaxis protein CheW [Marinilabiliaceae bacterium JC017]
MNQGINSYLTFKLGPTTFGVHVGKVIEIQEYLAPKAVPDSLSYVTGVFEYREEVIPLIDTYAKFNIGTIEITPQTCVVVLEILNETKNTTTKVGILVDTVADVFEATADQLKPIEDDYKPGYITATYKMGNSLIMMLNTNKVFSEKDITALDQLIKDFSE